MSPNLLLRKCENLLELLFLVPVCFRHYPLTHHYSEINYYLYATFHYFPFFSPLHHFPSFISFIFLYVIKVLALIIPFCNYNYVLSAWSIGFKSINTIYNIMICKYYLLQNQIVWLDPRRKLILYHHICVAL